MFGRKDSMQKTKTHRGLALIKFKDNYGVSCRLQKSSLATDHAVWFGVDDPEPKISIPGCGWVPYPIPEEVSIRTRMHLTQKQVKKLIPILQKFCKTGEL